MKTFSVSCAFDPYVKLCPDLNIAFFYFILYSNFVLHAIFDSVVLLLALLSLYIWLHNMNNSWNIRRIWIHYNEYKAIFSDVEITFFHSIQKYPRINSMNQPCIRFSRIKLKSNTCSRNPPEVCTELFS